jgi:hypothetical protein
MEDLSVDGRIKFEWIFEKQCEKAWNGLSGSGWNPVVGFCEHGNEPSDTTKEGEFLD